MALSTAVIAAGSCVLFVLAATVLRAPSGTASRDLALPLFATSVWGLASCLVINATTLGGFERAAQFAQSAAVLTSPSLFLAISAYVTGVAIRGVPLAALLAIPAATIALTWTNASHGWMWEPIRSFEASSPRFHPTWGPWFWRVHFPFSYALLAGVLALVVRELRRAKPRIDKGHLWLTLSAIALPIIVNVLATLRRLPDGVPFSSLANTASGVLLAWGFARVGFPHFAPIAHRTVFEQIRDGVVVADAEGRVRLTNTAATALSGRSESALLGADVASVLPDAPEVRALLADGAAGTVTAVAAGDRHLEIVASPIRDAHGEMRGRVFLLRDISEREQARRQNEWLLEQLRVGKERAESASQAKTKFLAAASHDLRQPLHALRLLVSALRGARSESQRAELIPKLDAATDSLGSLLEALLDLSRAEAGVIEAQRSAFSAQRLLDALEAEWSDAARAKGLELRIVRSSLWLESDLELVKAILRNFVANAVRYTASGLVLVGCKRRGANVSVAVWDTGPGIAPEDQRAIFREFHQLGNAARSREHGLGLGLAIVERLAALLGHRVVLRSKLGHGSGFAVEVPRAPAPRLREVAPREEKSLGALRVAVLDDDREVLGASLAALRGFGAEPIGFADPEHALDVLARSWLPDVLLVDLRLPGERDGIEWVDELRKRCGVAVPAIVVTGDTAPAVLAAAYSHGLAVLHKPVRELELRRALERYVAS